MKVGTLAAALAITAVLTSQAGKCTAAENLLDVFPESELTGPQTSQGGMSVTGLLAVQAALVEMQRRGINANEYVSVTVNEAGASYHVLFSRRPLNSDVFGSPGLPRPIIIRVRKSDFAVLGSFVYTTH